MEKTRKSRMCFLRFLGIGEALLLAVNAIILFLGISGFVSYLTYLIGCDILPPLKEVGASCSMTLASQA